jgi:hypothetical protein
MTSHTSLGIDPSAKILGSTESMGRLLIRAKDPWGNTLRYVACHDSEGSFTYFRRVTSSERKRLGRGKQISCPLEKLDWKQVAYGWIATHGDLKIATIIPQNLLSPCDYSAYSLNGKLVSRSRLMKEIENENHNYR